MFSEFEFLSYALIFYIAFGGILGDLQLNEAVKDEIYKVNQKILEPLQYIGPPINNSTLKFFLVTPDNLDDFHQIDFYRPDIGRKCAGTIFFVVHGIFDGSDSLWVHDLAEVLLKRNTGSCTVVVDWSSIVASLNIPYVFSAAEKVGVLIGEFVNRLLTEEGISKENITVIAHSLGAQAVAFASKALKKLSGIILPLIVALDPGGVTFNIRPISKRLNAEDAEVVMAIHTDWKFGFIGPCGTIDFFPNGGISQPGCYLLEIACNHLRSLEYFIEAVNKTGSFPARKCESYEKYLKNQCDNNALVYMSDLKTKETGRFYLRTNSQKPFSHQENDAY